MDNTLSSVRKKFSELFKKEPLIVRSPGRINLIGEHTDYNDGFVMPAAIDKEVIFAMAPSDDGTTKIHSLNFNETQDVNLSNPAKVNSPQWINYLLGVIYSLQSKGHSIRPFVCVVGGNIPVGAGLSSSAAFECGFTFGLNELNKLNLAKLDMVMTAQWSEHNYAGVKCGIMDQFASVMGREGHVFVLDCRDLTYNYFPFESNDYQLVLMDSCVKHTLASSEYNTRRQECETGVALLKKYYPAVRSLRDVTPEMLEKHVDLFTQKVYNRCMYVVEENLRVQAASLDLKNDDLTSFGEKMYLTHDGLSRLYEVSCVELDFLVDQAKAMDGVLGSRMMGGGFGGCTINIVSKKATEEFISKTSEAYQKRFGVKPLSYVVSITDGTAIIK